jgi:hypothetical protein
MRSIQVLLAIAFMLSATQSFAHHDDKNGPCASYRVTCKDDPSVTGATDHKAKWKAMQACVSAAAAADTTSGNGPKCTAAMAHHKGGHMMEGDKGAPAAAPTNQATPASGT